MRRLSLVLILVLAAGTAALALGSLTREESVWKKTSYACVIRSIVEDDQGRLYLGTFGAGLWIREGVNWRQVASPSGSLADPRVSRLLLEGDDLLVATAGGGAARMNRTTGAWSHLVPDAPPPFRHFHAFLALATGSYLLGSVGEGICLSSGPAWITRTESDGLPSDWVNDALATASGTWLGTWDGLARLEGTRIALVEMPAGGWKSGNINVLALFGGRLYLGTATGGLVERSEPAPVAKGTRPSRPQYRRVVGIPDQVHALLPVGDSLWVGTEDGLFRVGLDGKTFPEEVPASASRAIKSLGLSRQGILVGTDIGQVYLLSDKKWVCVFDFPSQHGGGKPE
ncbi:MAG: hypothetical protein GX442_13610 [Candidatus Riflebacteria bacterium]|nr:hypothetical protein [Candidatus Riflebacteria bacterium]